MPKKIIRVGDTVNRRGGSFVAYVVTAVNESKKTAVIKSKPLCPPQPSIRYPARRRTPLISSVAMLLAPRLGASIDEIDSFEK